MSRVEQVEGIVKSLTADELRTFREWFENYDADAWDRQMESEGTNSKIRKLAEEALEDHRAGLSKEL